MRLVAANSAESRRIRRISPVPLPSSAMFEERERTYKQGLIERIDPHIGKGERVQAVAVTQVGLPPWMQAMPMVVGIALVVASLFVLPGWAGIVGALLVLVGIVNFSRITRRLLARTNRSVHVFDFPRSQASSFEEPRASIPLAELPVLGGASVRLEGERLWANYGSGLEREALAEVLAPVED